MKLVEVVRTILTDEAIYEQGLSLANVWAKCRCAPETNPDSS